MDRNTKILATLMVLAFLFSATVVANELSAEDDNGLLVSPSPVQQMEGGTLDDNYVHLFSLAIVAILVLAVLGYLHIKAHKK